MSTPLEEYLSSCNGKPNAAMCSYVANLQQVAEISPEIAASIVNELENQRSHLKLVASENYCSLNVQAAMGNLLTDKYAEGYPEHRYYGGCVNIDAVENTAAREAEKLFEKEKSKKKNEKSVKSIILSIISPSIFCIDQSYPCSFCVK